MKIAFWSPFHGTGTTACIMAVAGAMSQYYGRRCLLTQTHFEMNDLDEALAGKLAEQDGEDYCRDMGTDALIRYFKAGILTEDMVGSCTVSLSDRLSLLIGSRQTMRESFESAVFTGMLLKIYRAAEKFFDVLLIDVNSGYSRQSMEMIENADLVAVVLRQGRRWTGDFIKRGFPVKDKERFYLFGRYFAESKYSLKNMRKLYGDIAGSNSGIIPFDAEYMDVIDERRVLRYFERFDMQRDSIIKGSMYHEACICAGKMLRLAERRKEP